ncbi:hypothetical protein ALP99_101251 [Pseudomonas syringae pv. tomato]|uniref:Uncharacterized protein n=1 Tax=Pseudomonas syringae pv. tagetis TaxID=129140 RepID=A0A3M3Z2V7_9PSED|nr:Uncharacterized protein ALO84_04833 [Pseudomonas syringae pv. maculicola]MCF5224636.1 hypothetical protein [Pseudomonas syringae]RMO89092.1 hypothetical protein ALQ32_05089 [Pseudomonas syringae pv. tagetis]RMQ62418.1 hypothetical protein ALQ00_05011 [Pseudomonas syringae pv. tomato]MCF5244435.1 hypothetical protein [Pseudomonas syringae]
MISMPHFTYIKTGHSRYPHFNNRAFIIIERQSTIAISVRMQSLPDH